MNKSLSRAILTIGLSAGILAGCAQQPNQSADDPHSQVSPSPSDQGSQPAPGSDGGSDEISQLYGYFDPNHEIDTSLLRQATVYFNDHKSIFQNQNYLAVIDFSLNSSKKRFFIINIKTGAVWSTYTAHGIGSDPGTFDASTGYARFFSNVAGSNETSIGPYKTAETYQGKHGLSMRLTGLASSNSNAFDRAIVVHGADYVHDQAVKQGRSDGCPALPLEYYEQVINQLKGGSLIFAGTHSTLQSPIASN